MVEAYGHRNKLEFEVDRAIAKKDPKLDEKQRGEVVQHLMGEWDKSSPDKRKGFEENIKATNQQKQQERKRDNDFER